MESLRSRFDSSLFEIKQLLQADLFDSELDAARELLNNGFLRASGAICGVILEKHLGLVCTNHSLSLRKKNPAINDYNQLLKDENVIEVPTWRLLQRLADIRYLCDHNKEQEPKKDETEDLINEAIIYTFIGCSKLAQVDVCKWLNHFFTHTRIRQ